MLPRGSLSRSLSSAASSSASRYSSYVCAPRATPACAACVCWRLPSVRTSICRSYTILPSVAFCQIPLVYYDYVFNYRRWITLVFSCVIPMCILLVCNWVIKRTLRWELKSMAAEDSVTRTTVMCLGVSIACIICILPMFVFEIIYKYYPVTPLTRAVVWQNHSFPAIRQH